MASTIQDLKVPYRDQVVENSGLLTKAWQEFFKFLKIFIDPLGIEKTYTLLNNQAVAVKIMGLRFNSNQARQIFLDYFIQRVTSTTELVEAGTLRVVYRPDSQTWALDYLPGNGPDVSGVTFSIDPATGEIYYTSTNLGGTAVTSKASVRAKTLSGGNQQ